MLTPLVAATANRHAGDHRADRGAARLSRGTHGYFADLKLGLLDKRIALLAEDWTRQNAQVERGGREACRAQLAEESELKAPESARERRRSGSERLAEEDPSLTTERESRQRPCGDATPSSPARLALPRTADEVDALPGRSAGAARS